MPPAILLAGLVALLTLPRASLALPVPVPQECGCTTSPLSLSSFEQAKIIINARRLTPEECAFICNPHGSLAPDTNGSTPPAERPVELPPPDQEVGDPGPPLFDPVAPRPLPLFDSPQQTLLSSPGESHPQPRPPPLPSNRIPTLELHSPAIQPLQLSINTLYSRPIQPPINVSATEARVTCSALRLLAWSLLVLTLAVCIVRIGGLVKSAGVRAMRTWRHPERKVRLEDATLHEGKGGKVVRWPGKNPVTARWASM